jgi:hypothetical protein
MKLRAISLLAVLLLAFSPSMGLPATRLTIGHSTINPCVVPLWIFRHCSEPDVLTVRPALFCAPPDFNPVAV